MSEAANRGGLTFLVRPARDLCALEQLVPLLLLHAGVALIFLI
jgi:hypothetical protein